MKNPYVALSIYTPLPVDPKNPPNVGDAPPPFDTYDGIFFIPGIDVAMPQPETAGGYCYIFANGEAFLVTVDIQMLQNILNNPNHPQRFGDLGDANPDNEDAPEKAGKK